MEYSDRELLARIIECEAGGEGNNRYESNCDSMLTANSLSSSIEYDSSCDSMLKTNLQNSNINGVRLLRGIENIDTGNLTNVFTDIKEKGILNEPLKLELKTYSSYNLNSNFKDYIDQFIYYRKINGYTQEEVGQVLGMTGKEYYKIEKRIRKLTNIDEIKKVASFLNINNSELMINLNELKNTKSCKDLSYNIKLKEYLIKNNISNSELSRRIGISRRSIIDWFNKGSVISNESVSKVEKFINQFERSKNLIKKEEEEF